MLTVIFKCDRCQLTRSKEVEKKLVNNTLNCPKCNNLVTLFYREKEVDLGDIAKVLDRIAVSLESINSKIDTLILPPIAKLETEIKKAKVTNKRVDDTPKIPKDNHPELYQAIIKFLDKNKITLNSASSTQEVEPKLQTVANMMGKNYQSIRKLHEAIKINLTGGKEFTLDLSNDGATRIGAITQLCSQLRGLDFLEEYHYEKRHLKAKPSQNPKAINFFTGGWLELYLRKQMITSLRRVRPQAKYAYLFNAKIKLANGESREIDIIFKTEKELFWFEAKTKDYQGHIHKYHHLASVLNLDRDHVYLILASAPESIENLSSLYNLKVMTVEQFPGIFEAHLKQNS